MGALKILVLSIAILYLIFGALMYSMDPSGGPLTVITGPAGFFWNLIFGFLGV
jgi:hypothetical protein